MDIISAIALGAGALSGMRKETPEYPAEDAVARFQRYSDNNKAMVEADALVYDQPPAHYDGDLIPYFWKCKAKLKAKTP